MECLDLYELTLHHIPNTPKGDDSVEEEGGSKMVIFKLLLVRLVHFIKP